ncbi:MAG: hypothetical protein ACREBS_06825 [Nitrososphaerales archaeon]
MSRKGRIPLRLDIVGLIPEKFQDSLKNAQALVESRTKGSVSEVRAGQPQSVTGGIYNKIALIALDFQRAYGRAVQIRVFEKSSNRFFEKILSLRGSSEVNVPVFFVNGVRIYRGIPNSFSELDEAIENAFGKSR